MKNNTQPKAPRLTELERNLIEDSLAIETEEAKQVNAVGYMARTLAQATLPHSDPGLPPGMMYSRDTGRLTLTIAPTSPRHGIPYGTVPRIILAWMCTEAVKKQQKVLSLGRSQTEFLEKLQMHNNGRDIGRVREQMMRLLKSVFSVEYAQDSDLSARLLMSSQTHVFWNPKHQDQESLWDSTLELEQTFFDEITKAAVPIDLNVYHALSRSPFRMDIYTWLTYRMFVLQKSGRPSVKIPWVGLKTQFGSGYADDEVGLKNFKAKFKGHLKEVLRHYRAADNHVDETKDHLILTPAPLHIAQRK